MERTVFSIKIIALESKVDFFGQQISFLGLCVFFSTSINELLAFGSRGTRRICGHEPMRQDMAEKVEDGDTSNQLCKIKTKNCCEESRMAKRQSCSEKATLL